MAGGYVKEFTDDNFATEVLGSRVPVVIDFTAPWCGPCKMLAPIIEDLAKEFDGKVKIGKLNVDESPQTASKYTITNIPALLFIKNGSVKEQHVGLMPKPSLKAKIEQFSVS